MRVLSFTIRGNMLKVAMVYLTSVALVATGFVVGVTLPANAAACSGGVAPSGSGTSGSPYLISNAAELIWMSEQTTNWNNQHFRQTAGIDLGGCEFTPIGKNTSSHFKGTYDGQGFTIEGLKIRETTSYAGLFGDTNETAVFRNIRLVEVDIESTGRYVGALVGRLTGSSARIENSYSTGTVRGQDEVGGLVGILWISPRVENSYSSASVTTTANFGNGGGLAGEVITSATVTNVYARGRVSPADGVTPGSLGGLVGGTTSATATASFYDSDVMSSSAGGIGKTTAEMKSFSTFDDAGWDIVDGWEAYDFDSPTNEWGICSGANDGYPFLLWQYSEDPCVVDSGDSNQQTSSAVQSNPDVPGIYLAVKARMGDDISGSAIGFGGFAVAPNAPYLLTVQPVQVGSAQTVLARGVMNSGGHLEDEVTLGAFAPGAYKVVFVSRDRAGALLTLANVVVVGPDGRFQSITPEELQPRVR